MPAVADGIDASTRIYRQSFIETLADLSRRFTFVTGARDPELHTGPEAVEATHRTIGREIDGFYQIRVESTGIVRSTWRVPQEGAGYQTLQSLLQEGLPMHRKILEDLLGHRGDVVVLAANRWLTGSGARRLRTVRDRVSVADVGSQELLEALDRDLQRGMGGLVYEPE